MASDLSTLMINQTNPVNLYVAGMNINNVSLPSTVNIQDGSSNKQALTLALENITDGTYNLSIYQKPWLTLIGAQVGQSINTTYNGIINVSSPTINGQNYGTYTGSTWTTSVKGFYKVFYNINKIYAANTVENGGNMYLNVNGAVQGQIYSNLNGGNAQATEFTYMMSGCYIVALNQTSNVVYMGYQTTVSAGSLVLSSPNMVVEFVAPINA